MSQSTSIQSRRLRWLHRSNAVPGPQGHFFWGMIPEMRRDLLGMYRRAAQEYGDVVRLTFMGLDTYALSHPDHFKHVLQDNNRNYVRNQWLNNILKLFAGENLFTADDDSWLSRRRLMQPAFHRQRILGFGALMSRAIEQALDRWDAGPDGQRLEIDQEMMQLTLRVAGQALFSRDLLGEASALGEAFTATSEFINYRMRQPFPVPPSIPIGPNRRFRQAQRFLDQTIAAMIRERRGAQDEQGDLLGMLMQARDQDTGRGMTDEQLHNEIAVMMFAGHETTAVTLTWTFYLLSQNPQVEQRLQAELDQVLGGRAPTVDDLPRLPYNRMVVEESLRLYPPAVAVTRQTVGPDEIGGHAIPAGASVSLIVNNVHHDPRFWDEPERFEPERFTPERAAARPHLAYVPFGAGPRLCIGNQFALTEAQLVLASVAQRYRLRLVPGHRVAPNPIFVLRTTDGLPMTVHRR